MQNDPRKSTKYILLAALLGIIAPPAYLTLELLRTATLGLSYYLGIAVFSFSFILYATLHFKEDV